MSERLHLAMPLEVDGWEVIESLEGLSLFDFDGYRDLANNAIAVLHDVQGIWREHQGADGEWSEQATAVMSKVLRLAYNIRQSHQRYGEPLSDRIRSSVGVYGESPISNAQLEAAMAMSSACWALRTLANWLEWFETELYRVRPDLVERIEKQDPEGFAALVERRRGDLVSAESEALEGVRRYLGEADVYLARATGTLREVEALNSVRKKKSEDGKKAGSGNSHPDSVTQTEAVERCDSTVREARKILRNNPKTPLEGPGGVVSRLAKARIYGSRTKIRSNLRSVGILPESTRLKGAALRAAIRSEAEALVDSNPSITEHELLDRIVASKKYGVEATVRNHLTALGLLKSKN